MNWGGTCAHLSAPRHSLVNPSQCASMHTSVVPPCPRNVTGKAQADEAQSPCPCLLDLEGLLPWADDHVCPCTLTLICFSPWQVGQIETNAPSPMQTSSLRGFHLDAAPGSPCSVLVRVMYRVRAWEALRGDSVWGTHRVFPKHWMTSGEKG